MDLNSIARAIYFSLRGKRTGGRARTKNKDKIACSVLQLVVATNSCVRVGDAISVAWHCDFTERFPFANTRVQNKRVRGKLTYKIHTL